MMMFVAKVLRAGGRYAARAQAHPRNRTMRDECDVGGASHLGIRVAFAVNMRPSAPNRPSVGLGVQPLVHG